MNRFDIIRDKNYTKESTVKESGPIPPMRAEDPKKTLGISSQAATWIDMRSVPTIGLRATLGSPRNADSLEYFSDRNTAPTGPTRPITTRSPYDPIGWERNLEISPATHTRPTRLFLSNDSEGVAIHPIGLNMSADVETSTALINMSFRMTLSDAARIFNGHPSP